MSLLEKLTFSTPKFNPERDIPSLAGKVIIVTGGNNGIGKETILQLAKHDPAKIYMASRNEQKAAAAIQDIKSKVPNANLLFLKLDVASLQSVKDAADEFLAQNERLDLLVNNAGIMVGVPPSLSPDGYEITFATNHLGPALFTKLLTPILSSTSKSQGLPSRVVNIASYLHIQSPSSGIPYDKLTTTGESISTMQLYGATKLANIYHATELARRHPDILAVSLHPGLVKTDIVGSHMKDAHSLLNFLVFGVAGRLISVNVPEGALTQLWASTAAEVKSSVYYEPYGKEVKTALNQDAEAARKLWEWTEEQFRVKGY